MWILLHASGTTVIEDIHEFLKDPYGKASVREFKGAQYLRETPDAGYWPEGVGMLLKADVVVPESVTREWKLP